MTEKEEPKARLDYQSPEEFRLTCRRMASRLHHLNRVAIGESVFAWHVADMLQRLGVVFEEQYRNEDVKRMFGDGWTKGEVPREAQAAALFELMYPPDDPAK